MKADDPAIDVPHQETRLRPSKTDLIFAFFLAAYTCFAIVVLLLGVGAVVAAASPTLHQTLHILGFAADSLPARAALGMANASHRSEPAVQLALDYVFSLFNLGLALYLIWLRPRNPTARLLALGMIGTAAIFNLQAQSVFDAMPAALGESALHFAFQLVAMAAYFYALLLFPEGKLIPRWSKGRLLVLYVPATVVVALASIVVQASAQRLSLIIFFGLLAPITGVVSQAYRYRRSMTEVERQQSRLLFWALAPALIVGLFVLTQGVSAAVFPALEGRPIQELPVAIYRVFQAVFTIIPVALLVGILRYRLWDIDRIISRTLAYGALAAFVTAVYIGVVIGIGNLIGSAEGNLGLSIAATGLVAVAFGPVKDRLQRVANRLVYGNRATPYEVLSTISRIGESFGSDDLLLRWIRMLARGTGARKAEIWLKVGSGLRRAAVWPDDPSEPALSLPLQGNDLPAFAGVDRAVAVRHQGQLLGVLTVLRPAGDPLNPAEDKLITDLASQAGLVLKNVGLTAELLDRLEDLKASRQRLVAAQDEERRRLERNIHDGAQQQLVALKLQLSLAEGLAASESPKLQQLLAQLKAATDEAVQTLRDLAHGIYPPLLATGGLIAALEAHCRRVPLPVEVSSAGARRYPPETEAAIYFCCLEALQNVVKSANASRATVRLIPEDGFVRFSVEDDGQGFDPIQCRRGAGLQNMIDRVEALGGSLEIHSSPGKGTRLTGRVPLS